MHELLTEMMIIGIIGIISIGFCLGLFFKHLHDKDWEKPRWLIMGCTVTLGVMVTIFEIVWFCMYLGLPV